MLRGKHAPWQCVEVSVGKQALSGENMPHETYTIDNSGGSVVCNEQCHHVGVVSTCSGVQRRVLLLLSRADGIQSILHTRPPTHSCIEDDDTWWVS